MDGSIIDPAVKLLVYGLWANGMLRPMFASYSIGPIGFVLVFECAMVLALKLVSFL
jgi:hypothetical protein